MKDTKIYVRDDLLFREFEELARREPDLDGDWIYRLEETELEDTPENGYPKFEVGMTHTYFFHYLAEAEKFMRSNPHNIKTYRSIISQIPIGEEYSRIGASWLYDREFNLVDYTITTKQEDKPYNSHFFGRPDSRQRFKEGEIVEVFNGEYVSLALLISNSLSIERCWSIYQKCIKDDKWHYHLDYFDDSVIVLEGPDYGYHRHLSPLALMKPSMPIPEDLEAEIKSWYERSKKAEEEMRNSPNNIPAEKSIKRGETIGDFGPLNLSIHYCDGIEIPHFHISDGYGLEVALRIDVPEYYDHEGAYGRLNDSQIEALMDYLSDIELSKTKWWYILRDWNAEEYGKPIPVTIPLPDYRELILNKEDDDKQQQT